jgi:hypothetical protein
MQAHVTGQGKHARLAPKIEKSIQLELIMLFGEGHFSTGDEERRFFPKGRGLDFDEALLPIGSLRARSSRAFVVCDWGGRRGEPVSGRRSIYPFGLGIRSNCACEHLGLLSP